MRLLAKFHDRRKRRLSDAEVDRILRDRFGAQADLIPFVGAQQIAAVVKGPKSSEDEKPRP